MAKVCGDFVVCTVPHAPEPCFQSWLPVTSPYGCFLGMVHRALDDWSPWGAMISLFDNHIFLKELGSVFLEQPVIFQNLFFFKFFTELLLCHIYLFSYHWPWTWDGIFNVCISLSACHAHEGKIKADHTCIYFDLGELKNLLNLPWLGVEPLLTAFTGLWCSMFESSGHH